jgi:hypothetical protein
MNTTNLMAKQEDGGKLIMMDGTIWIVEPNEIHIVGSWDPPCGIQIQEDKAGQEYDYQIINLDENTSVSAKKRR